MLLMTPSMKAPGHVPNSKTDCIPADVPDGIVFYPYHVDDYHQLRALAQRNRFIGLRRPGRLVFLDADCRQENRNADSSRQRGITIGRIVFYRGIPGPDGCR